MRAKPTPGPWRAEHGTEIEIVSSSPHTSATVAVVVARAQSMTAHADARLIAAAPELLEDGYALAMLGLQSDRYVSDTEFREAVDNLLALKRRIDGGQA